MTCKVMIEVDTGGPEFVRVEFTDDTLMEALEWALHAIDPHVTWPPPTNQAFLVDLIKSLLCEQDELYRFVHSKTEEQV